MLITSEVMIVSPTLVNHLELKSGSVFWNIFLKIPRPCYLSKLALTSIIRIPVLKNWARKTEMVM